MIIVPVPEEARVKAESVGKLTPSDAFYTAGYPCVNGHVVYPLCRGVEVKERGITTDYTIRESIGITSRGGVLGPTMTYVFRKDGLLFRNDELGSPWQSAVP